MVSFICLKERGIQDGYFSLPILYRYGAENVTCFLMKNKSRLNMLLREKIFILFSDAKSVMTLLDTVKYCLLYLIWM
jgi:hypothetical protein